MSKKVPFSWSAQAKKAEDTLGQYLQGEESGFDANGDNSAPLDSPINWHIRSQHISDSHNPQAWSSGICTCCNDMRSCCLGLWCPCIIFTRNAEVLEERPWTGPCLMHAWLWSVAAGVGYSVTHGTLFGFHVSCIPCYAYGYREILCSKHNLEDANFDDVIKGYSSLRRTSLE
ncbi:hypothetical protein KP509_37G037900 [Ceratopteris richardii]|uniref:Uncharacterized protein n=1 Tax=Ceratopteris richardii TaxID=49495 RepID=A0A8T2Q8B4_CERRI|nr:hypothetical protein KP509_37G037900 [Ceratopteris richardii]